MTGYPWQRGHVIESDDDLGTLVREYGALQRKSLKDFAAELAAWAERPTELAFDVEDYAIDRGWFLDGPFADVVSHCAHWIKQQEVTA